MHDKREKAASFHGYIYIKISHIHIKYVVTDDTSGYFTCKNKSKKKKNFYQM